MRHRSRPPRHRSTRLLAALLAFLVVAAACGGGDDDDAADDGEGQTGAATTASTAPEGEPQPGGKLVYGLEADTAQPWTPQNATCAISCHMVMRSVFDPLALLDEEGRPVGNLLTAMEPSADFTTWTLTVREGISFHDGTPLDGAAVADNLSRHRKSFLTGKALKDVADVVATGPMEVTVTMSRPWASFPVYLVGQIGYMASPVWLAAVDEDPAKAAQPVGTGPFVFKSYTPGGSFVATRNADYWREGLPYVDEIEYRVLASIQARSAALIAGDVDIIHTANGDEISKFRDRSDEFRMVESDRYGETTYVLLNVGDPASPLADRRVRCALAASTDTDAFAKARAADIFRPANGPFSPTQVGFLEDSGYPAYDPEQARELIAEYEAEKGDLPPLRLTTTNDEFNLVSNQLLQQMWKQAGLDAQLAQIEQGQFIVQALLGNFQAFLWRNHGQADPDAQRVWWHSETALPFGDIGSLNFGRIKDPVIDEALDVIRENPDEATRREAAETINRQFANECYNVWLNWVVWGIVSSPKVHNIEGFQLPDGGPGALGAGISGTHQVMQIWVEK